jgi:hypothetical protein
VEILLGKVRSLWGRGRGSDGERDLGRGQSGQRRGVNSSFEDCMDYWKEIAPENGVGG